jgi:hypothetical protein
MKNGLESIPNIKVGSVSDYVPKPVFEETVSATLGRFFSPVADYIKEQHLYDSSQMPEDGFIARENIPADVKQFSSSLLHAVNQEHMDLLVSNTRRSMNRRDVIDRSSLGALFVAELANPINLLSVPLRGATTVGRGMLNIGASSAAIAAAEEATIYSLDPTANAAEGIMNVTAAAVLGTTIGGLVTIPAARRSGAIKKASEEIDRIQRAVDEVTGAVEGVDGAELDPNIAQSIFTDSWVFKSVTTPMKRTLQNPKIPNSVKVTMLEIANDAGILLEANKKGQAFKNSVHQNSKLRDGEWVQVYDEVVNTWGESHGRGVTAPLDQMYKRKDFEAWLTDVDTKAMRGEKPADDFEAKAMDSLNSFYSKWESRLNEQGLLGNKNFYLKDIESRQIKINDIESTLERYRGTNEFKTLTAIVTKNKNVIKKHEAALKDIESSGSILPANEEIFRPRYWDKDFIKKNRAELESILAKWFVENPIVYRDLELPDGSFAKLDMSINGANKRASDAVDSILGLRDVTDFDVASFGHGKSKHMKHRGIDIPNKLVLDFIHKNPVSVMKAYTARTAPRYEFSKQFDGKEIDDLLDEKSVEMMQSGMSQIEINAALKDLRHMYDRVAGTVLREPDTLNQKTAEVLRTAAQLSYLGAAGLSTITEPAKIMMEHGVGKTFQGLFNVLTDSQLKMGAKEARIAGEALEILMGSSHMRLVDDMGNNPLRSNFMDKTKNAFYMLNGLAPITRIFKDFDGMMHSHTIIDYSVRLTKGKASKMEMEYLARYGIDANSAKNIAGSSWQKSKSGMYMADSESWTKVDMDLLRKDVEKSYKPSGKSMLKMSEAELLSRFAGEFDVDRIITDQAIVDDVFTRKGTPNILGTADGTELGSPATVYINKKNIRSSFEKFKNREDLDKFTKELDDALENGTINRSAYEHQMTYVNNADILQTEDDFVKFVMMHELHHTTTFQRVGEDVADYEKRIDGLAISYIRDEKREGIELALQKAKADKVAEAEETVNKFRNALNSGIANTILMGTPADKPIITDGIAYIPMRIASQFGMKEDPKYKGYARIENGLLGLPFQFYSYALAAVNKTTAAYGHGQLKNQFIGTAIAMGLGYTLLQYKTPDFVEMSFQDQFARAFDYSGVAPLYSDMFYTAMSTSLALNGPNLTGGALQPRYPQEQNAVDAATGLLGAGPSVGMEYAQGMANLVSGNVGTGTKEIIRALPFSNLWMIKDAVNKYTNMLEKDLGDGPSGFGRY